MGACDPCPGSGFQSRLKVAGAIAVLGLGYTLAAHVPLEQARCMPFIWDFEFESS